MFLFIDLQKKVFTPCVHFLLTWNNFLSFFALFFPDCTAYIFGCVSSSGKFVFVKMMENFFLEQLSLRPSPMCLSFWSK